MKKLLMFSLCAMVCVFCQAQYEDEEVEGGELFLQSALTCGTLTDEDYKYAPGFSITAGYQNHKHEGYFYECAMGITSRQYKIETDIAENILFVKCIHVSPLTVGLRTWRMEFTCGLYGSYDISGTSKTYVMGMRTKVNLDDFEDYNRFDCGIKVSARYYASKHIYIYGGVQRGFLSIYDEESVRKPCFFAFNIGVGLVL